MFRATADMLELTPISQTLKNAAWVVPTSQSIHIVCMSVVFGAAIMINMRLLGVGGSGRSISTLTKTLVPWIWGCLVLLLLTGVIQTITEPVRQFVDPEFWWKMVMIIVVVILTAAFAGTVRRNAARWDSAATRPRSAKVFAVVSTLLWIGIVTCGRLIGYTWELYA
jgi:hypothetical protein